MTLSKFLEGDLNRFNKVKAVLVGLLSPGQDVKRHPSGFTFCRLINNIKSF